MADLHDSTEHYLATIFEIQEEGIEIKRARIAERLNISAPSVTEHVYRMEKLGYVEVDENNNVGLTEKGKEKAATVVRRHRLAERLLVDVIGLDWAQAHKEADRWEHVISDEVEKKLITLLGDPATCPHGNPIPNRDGSIKDETKDQQKKLQPLSSINENTQAVIRRIGERIETDENSLMFVADNDLIPGATLLMSKREADKISVKIKDSLIDIPFEISESMYVEVS